MCGYRSALAQQPAWDPPESDPHAGQDDRAAAHPHIRFDVHRLAKLLVSAQVGVERVRGTAGPNSVKLSICTWQTVSALAKACKSLQYYCYRLHKMKRWDDRSCGFHRDFCRAGRRPFNRWRRGPTSSRAPSISTYRAAIKTIILVVSFILLYVVVKYVRADDIMIEPISVPPKLQEAGYSGAVVANLLVQEVRAIKRAGDELESGEANSKDTTLRPAER